MNKLDWFFFIYKNDTILLKLQYHGRILKFPQTCRTEIDLMKTFAFRLQILEMKNIYLRFCNKHIFFISFMNLS